MQLFQISDVPLVIDDGAFLRKDFSAVFQKRLFQLLGRVGLYPIGLGHLARRLVAVQWFQQYLELELGRISFWHNQPPP
jgi:hypothetical protein